MRDYMLAIGDRAPYGFSADSDQAAIRHASDYVDGQGARFDDILLSGPDGMLTAVHETGESLRGRVEPHRPDQTDDVRPADPTPPDCNTA